MGRPQVRFSSRSFLSSGEAVVGRVRSGGVLPVRDGAVDDDRAADADCRGSLLAVSPAFAGSTLPIAIDPVPVSSVAAGYRSDIDLHIVN